MATNSETDNVNWLTKEIEPNYKTFRTRLISVSILLLILNALVIYWLSRLTSQNSLLIGGLIYSTIGGILAVIGALNKTKNIALMCTTFCGANKHLFYELIKSRDFTLTGLSFLTLGFIIQGLGIII